MAASPVTFPGYVHPEIDWRVALFTCWRSPALPAWRWDSLPPCRCVRGNLFDAFKQASSHSAGQPGRARFPQRAGGGGGGVRDAAAGGRGAADPQSAATGRDPSGLRSCHVLALRVQPLPPVGRSHQQSRPRHRLAHLARIPSVEAAATRNGRAAGSGSIAMLLHGGGTAPGHRAEHAARLCAPRQPEFFQTLRIRFAGRADASPSRRCRTIPTPSSSAKTVAKRFWPGQDPIGKRIKRGGPTNTSPWIDHRRRGERDEVPRPA